MTLNIRMNFLTAAVLIGLSASANAATVTSGNSGAVSFSELMLVAYDNTKIGTATPLTYFRGLNVQMDSFLPNSPLKTSPTVVVAPGAVGVFAGGTRTPESGASFTQSASANDTAWASFLSQSSGASNISWGIFGRKAGGAAVAAQYPAAVYTGSTTAATGGQIGTVSSAFNSLMNLANTFGCDSAGFDSCVTQVDVGANLGSAVSSTFTAALNQSLGFTLAFKNIDTNNQNTLPGFVPFCNSLNCASWSINGTNGAVTYSLAEAVTTPQPGVVPVPAAGWLLLSGLAGLVGYGRRGKKAV